MICVVQTIILILWTLFIDVLIAQIHICFAFSEVLVNKVKLFRSKLFKLFIVYYNADNDKQAS